MLLRTTMAWPHLCRATGQWRRPSCGPRPPRPRRCFCRLCHQWSPRGPTNPAPPGRARGRKSVGNFGTSNPDTNQAVYHRGTAPPLQQRLGIRRPRLSFGNPEFSARAQGWRPPADRRVVQEPSDPGLPRPCFVSDGAGVKSFDENTTSVDRHSVLSVQGDSADKKLPISYLGKR